MAKPREKKTKIVDRIKSGNHSMNPGMKKHPSLIIALSLFKAKIYNF
jgi:hypothetical protein